MEQQQQKMQAYAAAREARITQSSATAASEAVALYQQLLQRYPDDVTTASHLAATESTPYHQQRVVQPFSSSSTTIHSDAYLQLRHYLLQANYTNQSVHHRVVGRKKKTTHNNRDFSFALSPIYMIPAAAGTIHGSVLYDDHRTALDCLVALFLVGATVSKSQLETHVGHEFVRLALSLSILYPSQMDSHRLVAAVQIFPVQLGSSMTTTTDNIGTPTPAAVPPPPSTLYVMTDWHPRVLSQTKVGGHVENADDEAVMYLGPDSMGLVQHFWDNLPRNNTSEDTNNCGGNNILDLCTGSGIQALFGLAHQQQQHLSLSDDTTPSVTRATCVDVNPRALRFVFINALLNGIDPQRLQLVQGDVLPGTGRQWCIEKSDHGSFEWVVGPHAPLVDLLDGPYDIVTANPPFLPVPPTLTHRHGAFSDGGGTGEDVLQAIVRLARQVLRPEGGILAVVSEFFLAPQTWNATHNNSSRGNEYPWTAGPLLERIHQWWWNVPNTDNTHETEQESTCCGFLVTNEFPVNRDTYATRRANSLEEYKIWMQHLEDIHMSHASPGFLFMKKKKNGAKVETKTMQWGLQHCVAPRSSRYGSLWTPSNPEAVAYTANLLKELYKR